MYKLFSCVAGAVLALSIATTAHANVHGSVGLVIHPAPIVVAPVHHRHYHRNYMRHHHPHMPFYHRHGVRNHYPMHNRHYRHNRHHRGHGHHGR